MHSSVYQPWLYRVALLTAGVALLPILVGALVTTKGAGMAFPDWPASDGQNMLLYPWLKSAGDKFLEHGHRLAGMLIGIVSIGLVVLVSAKEHRRWVKWLATAVLLGVVFQGLLGGERVLQDARVLGMLHGSFAAIVFSMMAATALVTSRGWFAIADAPRSGDTGKLKLQCAIAIVVIAGQYLLGGMVRHLGMVLHQHLGFALITAMVVCWLAWSVHRTGIAWLKNPATCLVWLVGLQLVLGAGTWVTKYGFGEDYVAVLNSPLQVGIRTSHFLVGLLMFMTTIVLTIRVLRLEWLAADRSQTRSSSLSSTSSFDRQLSLPGGAQ